MNPLADLYKRTEKLRTQIHAETDPALRKAMVKTHDSLMKEIRKASHHTSPAKMFLLLTSCLVIIVGGGVYGVAWLEHAYGWGGTVTSVALVIAAMIILTGMVFLVMKIIKPQTYKELVRIGTDLIKWLRPGTSHSKSEQHSSLPVPKTSVEPPPALPAPTVSLGEGDVEE